MNVGEKLEKLKNNTVIHIQSEKDWKIIAPLIGYDFNCFLPRVLKENFCIQKEKDIYTWANLDYFKEINYYIISSNDFMLPTIYELW